MLAACASLVVPIGSARPAERPPSLALIGFELVDDQNDLSQATENERRLALIHGLMNERLDRAGLYTMLDTAAAQSQIEKVRAEQAFVYRCNGCLGEIGAKLGTRLVAVGWVQKVSNLILNINLEIHDVVAGSSVLSKSVDLRGNTDESWSRGIAFMVRDMVERRQRNPRYGM